jgi:nitric-oxide synthase
MTVHAPWALLEELQNRLLDGTPLRAEEYADFPATGELVLEEKTTGAGYTCNCMQVPRPSILEAIHAGATTVALLQERLSCGTVCGGCLPTIRQLLGAEDWAPVRIVEERQLTVDVRRFRLRPIGREVARARPGQHVVLTGLVDGEWVRRPYTLTSACGETGHYEVMVKREPQGVFSGWLFDNAGEDSLFRVSPPQGDFFWAPAGAPAVCIVAGIGVTPAIAMLRSRAAEGWSEPLHVDVSVRGPADLAPLDELRAAAAAGAGVTATLRVTGDGARVAQADVEAIAARFPAAEFFLCGPDAFMDAVRAMLRAVGVPDERVRVEAFTPAVPKPAPARVPVAPPASPRRPAGGLGGLLRSLFRRQ